MRDSDKAEGQWAGGKGQRRRRHASFVARLAVSSALAALGCAGQDRVTNDPLIGAPVPRSQGSAALQQPTTPAATASTSLPPLTSPRSSASTAALTGGNVQPLDPNHGLRIADRDNNSAAVASRGQGPGMTAVLNRPEPLAGPTTATPATTGAMTAEARQSFDQAQAKLTARGVKWQKLEFLDDAGEWRFQCRVPNRQNADISRSYEVRAVDPVSALRAVLDQMDKER